MTHIVVSHIYKHLNLYDIITNLQHGFRGGFCCETQLIIATHDWASILNSCVQVDAIMLDFSTAFDRVSHAKLIHKLISAKTLLWLTGFLSNRTQFVIVDGSHSSHMAVTPGVPQGTVLGPTLLLLFINGIVNHRNSNMRIFADDEVVYSEISSVSDHTDLHHDLHSLESWAQTWQISSNISKCQYLSISNMNNSSAYDYTLNSQHPFLIAEYDY